MFVFSHFTSFSTKYPFSILRSSPGSHIAFSFVFLISSNQWQFFCLSWSLMTLTLRDSNGQVCCRMSFSLCVSDVFSWLDWGYGLWGEKSLFRHQIREIPCVYGLVLSMLTFTTCLRWWLPSFFTIKLVFFPL